MATAPLPATLPTTPCPNLTMCGLAGLAFHPDSPLRSDPKGAALLSNLLCRMAQRGRHATGLATAGHPNVPPMITKLAIPADQFTTSAAYETHLRIATASDRIWLGHTRHATHNNAHQDHAAHPYRMGNVTGAHNGIIYNWQDIMQAERPDPAWIVDSQAAFALLDKYKNPNAALDKLQGYWALTWIKRGRLYACKTPDADLAFAYLPAQRTLVWASTVNAIRGALRDVGLDPDVKVLDALPHTLYEFDPDEFTEQSAEYATTTLTFAGRKQGRYDTSRTDERALARVATALTGPVNGESLQQGLPFPTRRVRAVDPVAGKATATPTLNLTSPAGQFQALWTAVDRLRAQRKRDLDLLAEQAGEIETLKAEVEHLYEVLNASGIIDAIEVERA